MFVQLDIDPDTEAGQYFFRCARIRNITPSSLLKRLVDTMTDEQMIPAVLDDQDDMLVRRKGEHRYREGAAV